MSTIRKRISEKTGKVSWQIDYFDPNNKRVRQSFKKKKDAEAELGKRVSLIAENRYLDEKKDYKNTIAELIEKYTENYSYQPSYNSSKYYFVRNFKEHFGKNTLLGNISYMDLETYRNQVRRVITKVGNVRTNASVSREMSCLHHLFSCAVRWEMMEVTPFGRGPSLLLKENNERLRFLSEDEIDRLIDVCPPYLNHIVSFCIHTGARRQEVLNLKWHQVKNGHIYFEETKTDNPRQVPISDELQELLEKLRSKPRYNVYDLNGKRINQGNGNNDYVFIHKGEPVGVPKVIHAFITACRRADIPYGLKTPDGVTFHTLRHTFGSWLAMRGVPIKTIQELMGHKNISMTMRYAHLAENAKVEAVSVLNGLTNKKNRDCHKTVTRAQIDNLSKKQASEITTNI